MNFSVVILSRDAGNLVPCVQAILAREPGLRRSQIVVVDDGAREKAEPELAGLTWIAGTKPFCFARNVNHAIWHLWKDSGTHDGSDIILLNDDALLKTDFGFSSLSAMAALNPEYGLLASSCNNVGNANQEPQGWNVIRPENRMVCFVCVYIPRTTINSVSLLDESFNVGYGVEDDDYSLRVRRAGFKIGVWDGCFVDHESLRSSFRGESHADFRPNLQRFIEKWGVDNFGQPRETSQFKELFK